MVSKITFFVVDIFSSQSVQQQPERTSVLQEQQHDLLSNLSFYWHHSGFDNYNMGRLVNEINITKGCGIKDNFFCC